MQMIRGYVSIFFIIVLITLGAILLAGGVFPKPPGLTSPAREAIPDTSITPPQEKKSLQLETLPFKECASIATVDFLVDNSGSMEFGQKMPELKKGMSTFSSSYPDSGIIGLQIYSSPERRPPLGYQELVPISLYKDVKSQFKSSIESMTSVGGTHSKDAMNFVKQKLLEAGQKFSNYKLNLIFISDGIPETGATNDACPGGINGPFCGQSPSGPQGACRCFAQEQDPTQVAAEIKNAGVRIFTIAYVDTSDAKFNDRLQNLMKNVASTPSDYYQAPVESQLTTILSQISQKLCN